MSKITVADAVSLLKSGATVAIPTETVYGLAGSIYSEEAINQIFTLKGRPLFDPLIVHIAHSEMIPPLVSKFGSLAKQFAQKYWPGPMTLILPKSDRVKPIITAGLDKVGIRIPNQPLTIEIIKDVGSPIAAPSANTFKKTSPTKVEHVEFFFGEDFPIVDGGQCSIGIESTVLELNEERNECFIYRQGFLTKEQIEKDFPSLKVTVTQSPISPGQMNDHYMPEKKLILFPNEEVKETYIKTENLDETDLKELVLPEDPKEMMRSFYGLLHSLKDSELNNHYFNLKRYEEHFENQIFHAILEKLIKASSVNLIP